MASKLGFKNFYVYSSVSPKTGTDFSLLMPYVNTECMNVFLKEMSDWLQSKKALLILDQAGWHKSAELVIPDNISMIYLPPYSPELNPVERLWQYIKDNILKNKVYDRLEQLEDDVCAFMKLLQKDVVRSVCNVKYMPYYL